MAKEPKESNKNVVFSLEFSDINRFVQAAMTYRIALYNADGGRMLAIPAVIAVVIALIIPKVIGFLAVVALFRGISARFVRQGAEEEQQDDAAQDAVGDVEKLAKARDSLKEKVKAKRLDIDVADHDEGSKGNSSTG
jgi:hypothetical protein